jgi:hypothetical protein
VQGTSGTVLQTCFPTGNVCIAPAGSDLSGVAGDGGDSTDLAGADFVVPNCTPPASSGVTTSGGSVDRLFFGYTGDTRPSASTSSYPAALQTINNTIYTQMGA